MVWPVLFALVLGSTLGALVLLWPALAAAGMPIAFAIGLAVLVVSLGPVLLLRGLMLRPADQEPSEQDVL